MRTLLFATLTLALLLLCVAFCDRPVADFFYHLFGQTQYRYYLDLTLIPVALSLIPLLIGYLWVTKAPEPAKTLGLALAGLILAVLIETALKQCFGRSSVNPLYLYQHTYSYRPFHASNHWDSFPSGTASVAWALASVISRTTPKLKRIATVLACLACLVVLAANAHWVSDLIAGTLLGIGVGRLTVDYGSRLIRRRPVCV